MHAQPLSTSASLAGRENRSGVILGSQEVNALLRRTVQFQPLLPFDRDRPGRRQPLNLRGPLDGKPTVADREDDPIADDIVSGGPLRSTRGRLPPRPCFSVPSAVRGRPRALCCSPPPTRAPG